MSAFGVAMAGTISTLAVVLFTLVAVVDGWRVALFTIAFTAVVGLFAIGMVFFWMWVGELIA